MSNLFASAQELTSIMRRLEFGCDKTAGELRERLSAQERAIQDLGKYGAGIQLSEYRTAHDLVVSVTAQMMNADRLERIVLRLECDYVKLKARADRSRSNVRFEPFWEAFDSIVQRHLCSDLDDAYARAAAQVPLPHPKPSVAEKRYRQLTNRGF
ncbi:TPA: hypothetical protein QDB15_006000 [Burkholderia vietnamiensis]|uniref:hypothetical protein n=1 Tax=Burkholderia vietnamiensis TaxID=60552 RepID=UPI001593C8F4|nr:hypothetical protein [Burkholderia vietnamiensis]MCA8207135.1 hypothetical protein [Burkholderia vietnamiensis]HDR9101143.1 hypothetical protein [Burkholderia vietnamiensis]HDR9122129.1 hypothetical protein [Burkholderia vietnamiensis]HDR9167961.1 hypothetical protein [Burkholderia vietnamiensis]HDR9281525.1 hypothetical protein [Burkholderia vietnamiensis]